VQFDFGYLDFQCSVDAGIGREFVKSVPFARLRINQLPVKPGATIESEKNQSQLMFVQCKKKIILSANQAHFFDDRLFLT